MNDAIDRRNWWNRRWGIALAIVASALPLLRPHIPPLADLPGHMASYHVSIALAQSPALQRFYAFDWQLIGNLGVDLLVVPLAAVVGVEPATKLIVIAIPVLTVAALLLLARQAHGRLPATALAAVPIAYNSPFFFGFVNYSLAAAVALLGLALWMRWPSDRRPIARAMTFGAIAIATWLAHAIGWVMLAALCGSAELQRRHAAGERLMPALVGTALACLTLILPLILNMIGTHAGQGGLTGWFSPHAIGNAVAMILRDRWVGWDLASVALLLMLVIAASFRVMGLRLTPSLAWPALALAALLLVLPLSIDGSYDVNTRIAPYALALAIVAIDTAGVARSRQRWLAAAAALFCVARLASNTVSVELYDERYRQELAAVDHIPRGAAVLNLVEMPCRPGWRGWRRDRLEHLAGIATVRRDAFVNVMWTIQGLQLLRDRMPQATPFRDDPSQFVASAQCRSYSSVAAALSAAPLGTFTHLWLIGVPADERPHDARLTPIWANRSSILYRVRPSDRANKPVTPILLPRDRA